MQVIKETKSLSPLSGKEVSAKVVLDKGIVYLLKYDETGREYKSVLETDYNLYKQLTRVSRKDQASAHQIFIYVSSACNLKCPLCYDPFEGKRIDIAPGRVGEILRAYQRKPIILAGREPTCNPQLPGIIRIASQRNFAELLTNGIKLADYDYLVSLKEAGLERIIFSFNGFSDDVYKKMNGAPLLKLKLKALDNIKKTGIPTEISVTIVKGLNENHLGKIYDFCMENLSWVKALRIRSTSPVGRHLGTEQFTVSELIELISSSIGEVITSRVNKEDILRAGEFTSTIGEVFHIPVLSPRLCSFTFYLMKGGHHHPAKSGQAWRRETNPVGSRINLVRLRKSRFKRLSLVYATIKGVGFLYPLYSLWVGSKKGKMSDKLGLLKVELRSWPNIHNIDLAENRKCTSQYHFVDGKCSCFCDYNILQGIVPNG